MIAGVCTTFNEADIVTATIDHHLAEGLDFILVADASTDGTKEILRGYDPDVVHVYNDKSSYHFQPLLTKTLAAKAAARGADWIVPFDADEFLYAREHDSIRDALEAQPETITKLYVRMFDHIDVEHMVPHAKPLPKAVWRWHPQARPTNGNHDCHLPGDSLWGVLDLREVQYRSEGQFIRKVRERIQTLDPSLGEGEGAHHRVLNEMTDDQLKDVWQQLQGRETQWDPIPSRTLFESSPKGSGGPVPSPPTSTLSCPSSATRR